MFALKFPLRGFKVIRNTKNTHTQTSHKNVIMCVRVIWEIISLFNCINCASCSDMTPLHSARGRVEQLTLADSLYRLTPTPSWAYFIIPPWTYQPCKCSLNLHNAAYYQTPPNSVQPVCPTLSACYSWQQIQRGFCCHRNPVKSCQGLRADLQ